MNRLLPAPLMSASLFALWLVLNRSVEAGHLLLAAIVAIAVPALCAPLRPGRVRVRAPLAVLRLIGIVGYDVVLSNLRVGGGALRPRTRLPRSGFVHIPLELRSPSGLASLAIITTVIPGTVWSQLAPDRSELLLHVFEFDDEASFVAWFKARYERPLLEIFP